jgi:CSLREA domain-containing protein
MKIIRPIRMLIGFFLFIILSASLQSCALIETIFVDPFSDLADALDEACEQPAFIVTTEDDTNDSVCTSDDCSLREAIFTANYCPGEQEIYLPQGDYEVQRLLDGEAARSGGTLEITESVTIMGFDLLGENRINITAPTLDGPIFLVTGEYVGFDISHLNIENCDVGIRNEGNNVFIDEVYISNCTTALDATGPYPGANVPGYFLTNSILENNGTGIRLSGGWTSLIGSRITGSDENGIIGIRDSSAPHLEVTLNDTAIHSNEGAGVLVEGDVEVRFSSITGNRNSGCERASGLAAQGDVSIFASTIGENGHGCGSSRPAVLLEPSSGPIVSVNFATIAQNIGTGLQAAADVPIHASIIADNSPANCASAGGVVTSTGDNLDTDDTCNLTAAGDLPSTTPMLGRLTPVSSSSSTTTNAYFPDPSSPVIDAVTANCAGPDQKHDRRPNGDGCDIGAIEAGGSTTAPIVIASPTAENEQHEFTGQPLGPTTCRFGPNTVYVPLSYLTEDQIVSLLARTQDNSWLFVQTDDGNQTQCWVDRDLLDIDPDLDLTALPLGLIPPTPTWTPLPTDTPVPPQQGCLWYDQYQNVVCFASCPVDPKNSLGSCTP